MSLSAHPCRPNRSRRVRTVPARWRAPTLTALVVLAAFAVGGRTVRSADGLSRPEALVSGRPSHQPGSSATSSAGVSVTAGAAPDGLAEHVANSGDETESGRYTYVHIRDWAFATPAMAVFDEQVPVAADGSGREVRQRYPDQPARPLPHPATGRPVRVETEDHPVGGYPRSLPDPPSPDPSVLAAQPDCINARANSPQSVLRAIANLYRDTASSTPVRATMLRLLAQTPGLAVDGQVTDRADRSGIAVSIDSDTPHLDPHIGVLLADEATVLVKAPDSVLPGADVRETVVYLDAVRVNQLGVLALAAALRSTRGRPRRFASPTGTLTTTRAFSSLAPGVRFVDKTIGRRRRCGR